MNREFDFIDLYHLNDLNSQSQKSSELAFDEEIPTLDSAMLVIKISDGDDAEDNLTCTYAKFLEILDTEGLEGLVNL